VEKTFCYGIIPAISFSAHTVLDSVGFQKGLKLIAGVLDSPVRVMNQFPLQGTTLNRHISSFHYQLNFLRDTKVGRI
jgi:hypothetical protein